MEGGMESLSEDLLHQVLSYLPFVEVFRARTVCRTWLSALSSPVFYLLWSQRSSPSVWLLLHRPSDSSLCAFHSVSQLCLPLPCPSHPFSIIGSSHYILCLLHHRSLSLFNPLSRLSIPIPLPYDILDSLLFGFAFLPPPLNQFLIIFLSLSQRPSKLYNSALSSWVPLPSPPRLPPPSAYHPNRIGYFVWWNGKFCILLSGQVAIFDVHTSQWGTVPLPDSPSIWNLQCVTLHVIQGRLFLEGDFQQQDDFEWLFPSAVGILELDPTALEWMVTTFMPKEYAQLLCGDARPEHSIYTSFSDPDCDYMCFSPYSTANNRRLVYYHVAKDTWTSMVVDDKRQRYLFGFSTLKQWTFQPTFAALL